MNLAPESLPLSVTAKDLSLELGWERPGFLIRTATGAWIVDVDPENFDRDEMAEPFARLIAAAPDLLAVLVAAERQLRPLSGRSRNADLHRLIQGVIAKATTEQQSALSGDEG